MTDTWSTCVEKQWTALKNVPSKTMDHWPAYFTFAAVRVGTGVVGNLIPQDLGLVSTVLYAGFAGFTDVVKFVTWNETTAVAALCNMGPKSS